ncbi:hypothetical protein [Edaphobacter bradus]|uniref:hypothetical protein n=1 Tax=Edaphobacter bradus TaxID=2259016 RepID=UPI0021E03256|nr:hypothetical protein [Edaphobacter bradus]
MRRKLTYYAATAALFLSLGILFERPAYAYVDPGSSLLVYQSASAVITGALFYFRRRIKALLGISSSGTDNTSVK